MLCVQFSLADTAQLWHLSHLGVSNTTQNLLPWLHIMASPGVHARTPMPHTWLKRLSLAIGEEDFIGHLLTCPSLLWETCRHHCQIQLPVWNEPWRPWITLRAAVPCCCLLEAENSLALSSSWKLRWVRFYAEGTSSFIPTWIRPFVNLHMAFSTNAGSSVKFPGSFIFKLYILCISLPHLLLYDKPG